MLEKVLPAIGCPKPEFEIFRGEYMGGGEELFIRNLGYGICTGDGGVFLQRTVYNPGSRDEPPSEEPVDVEELSKFAHPAEVVQVLATLIAEDRIRGVLEAIGEEKMYEDLQETERLVEDARKRGVL